VRFIVADQVRLLSC